MITIKRLFQLIEDWQWNEAKKEINKVYEKIKKLEKENKELTEKGEQLYRLLGNLMIDINNNCKYENKEKIKSLKDFDNETKNI